MLSSGGINAVIGTNFTRDDDYRRFVRISFQLVESDSALGTGKDHLPLMEDQGIGKFVVAKLDGILNSGADIDVERCFFIDSKFDDGVEGPTSSKNIE